MMVLFLRGSYEEGCWLVWRGFRGGGRGCRGERRCVCGFRCLVLGVERGLGWIRAVKLVLVFG